MQKIYDAGEKLFFNTLIVCLLSCMYFSILPINNRTINIGLIFTIYYFGINFHTGYKRDLTIKESIIVGTMGCGVGLFLGFFSLYANLILDNINISMWLITPYIIPTISFTKLFSITVTLTYPAFIIIFNILLVILGSITKKIMNKLSH